MFSFDELGLGGPACLCQTPDCDVPRSTLRTLIRCGMLRMHCWGFFFVCFYFYSKTVNFIKSDETLLVSLAFSSPSLFIEN